MTDGMEISEALKLIGLSDYIVQSIKVGSLTGEITEIYKRVMEVLQNKLETKKKIKKLLVSPLISFSLLFGMFQFYMFFYYQQTKEILKYMDQTKFPDITLLFLGWSDYAVSSVMNGILFLSMSLFVFVSIYVIFKNLIKSVVRYIPGLKNILMYEDYIVFFSLLHVALSSNILLFRAIELSTEALKSYNLKKNLIKAVEEIESGGVQFSEVAIRNKIFNSDFESEAAISNFEETTDTKHFEILIEMQKEKLNDVIGTLSTFIQPILLLVIVICIIVLQYAANAPMWTFGGAGV
jgi:type II secretory pathway component PulF